MQKLKFRVLATVFAIVLSVLAMSAVAKKHVNEGLRWPTAWLALWSDKGWSIAMKAAIQDGASESEIIDRLGDPDEKIVEPDDSVWLAYRRPARTIESSGAIRVRLIRYRVSK